MVKCATCNHLNQLDQAFCGNCGTKLLKSSADQRFCTACGHENEPGQRFCTACGSKLAIVASLEPTTDATSSSGSQTTGFVDRTKTPLELPREETPQSDLAPVATAALAHSFWRSWFITHALLCSVMVAGFSYMVCANDGLFGPIPVDLLLLFGALGGALLAIVQWLALDRKIPLSLFHWIIASFSGWWLGIGVMAVILVGFSELLGLALPSILSGAVTVAFPFIGVGFMQWRLLRKTEDYRDIQIVGFVWRYSIGSLGAVGIIDLISRMFPRSDACAQYQLLGTSMPAETNAVLTATFIGLVTGAVAGLWFSLVIGGLFFKKAPVLKDQVII